MTTIQDMTKPPTGKNEIAVNGFKAPEDWYQAVKDVRENRPFPPRHGESGPTLADVIAHYLVQATDKKNHAGEQVYGKFWVQFLGTQSLAGLSAPQIDRARTHLLAHGSFRGPLSHSTVNRYIAWLHHVCALEVRKGTLPANPCLWIMRYPLDTQGSFLLLRVKILAIRSTLYRRNNTPLPEIA